MPGPFSSSRLRFTDILSCDLRHALRRLREIDSRVRFLNKRLDELEVVERAPADTSRIRFGAWVTLEDEAGDAWLAQHLSEAAAAPNSDTTC